MEQTPREKVEAVKLIAKKIMETAYRTILLEMRYIDIALAQLKPAPDLDVEYLATNGKLLFYNPLEVVKKYKQFPDILTHDIMHTLLHCVFRHTFNKYAKFPNYHLACDVAVEHLISTFSATCVRFQSPKMLETIHKIESIADTMTPQNLMTYFQLKNYSPEELEELQKLFYIDDPDYWTKLGKGQSNDDGDGDGDGDDGENNTSTGVELTKQQLEDIWDKVSRGIELNMKQQGNGSNSLQQKLKNLNREPYDYTEFLKKFCNKREVPRVNQDEFDYIFYTYGLNMYENMPLIEPLEYRDDLQITDFVIAIDTSGSTSGAVVQTFLQKTYNIFKSSESFGKTFNLYIIQCDAVIQEVSHITSPEFLDDYINNLTIKGLGGTDFRPVFSYVKKLQEEEKQLQNLKGLIYFTDGYGTFPIEPTKYDTAFIFVDKNDFQDVDVPPWAMKVLLTENDILEIKDKN